MPTVTHPAPRAAADSACAVTAAVMRQVTDPGARTAAAADEAAELFRFRAEWPELAGRLDAEMAAAETAPEVSPGPAAFAQRRALADLMADLEMEAG